jgi:hypothetical protein
MSGVQRSATTSAAFETGQNWPYPPRCSIVPPHFRQRRYGFRTGRGPGAFQATHAAFVKPLFIGKRIKYSGTEIELAGAE